MALTDKLTNIANAIREKTGSTRTMNLEEMAATVTNIKIPTALSDLNEDETHRTVTDAEKETWNNKSNFSGNYDDLKNKPTIPTIPEKLPNPNALTFTGAVEGSYDGSAPLSVEIPSGGGGTGGGNDAFELIGEATSSGVSDNVGLTIPLDGSLYKTIVAYAYNLPVGNNKRIIIRTKKVWTTGAPLGWNSVTGVNMNNTWGFFGAAIDVDGKLFTFGAAEAKNNSGHGYFRFYPQDGALSGFSLSNCKFISLDCNSSTEILPDGCSLIVWGVRK